MLQDRVHPTESLHSLEVMKVMLQHEIARVQRYPVALSLLRIALDYPDPGSPTNIAAVKKIVAHILKVNLRGVDSAGYYENDCLIILPVTNESGALIVAKRLTKLLYNTQPIRYGKQIDLTSFMGIATLPEQSTVKVDDFLTQSAKALAEARQRAPGSIVAYSEVLAQSA